MELIFRHFAIALVAVVLVNAVIARARIPKFVAAGGADPVEAERFVWLVAAWLIALFALDEIFTVTSGASSPLCFLPTSHPSGIWQYLAWALWIGWVLGVTTWIWIGRGAERVARFGPLFARRFETGRQYQASTIRVVTLLWCIGTIAMPLLMPDARPSAMKCP